jgi:hypothetical protein
MGSLPSQDVATVLLGCKAVPMSPATVRKTSPAVAEGKRIKFYPLSQAANPRETVFVDAIDIVYDSTIRTTFGSCLCLQLATVSRRPQRACDVCLISGRLSFLFASRSGTMYPTALAPHGGAH